MKRKCQRWRSEKERVLRSQTGHTLAQSEVEAFDVVGLSLLLSQ